MLCNPKYNIKYLLLKQIKICNINKHYTTTPKINKDTVTVGDNVYRRDNYTNITPNILGFLGRNIHLQRNHPLSILRQKIVNYFYGAYVSPRGNPLFSVYDNLSPVVTIEQNFDNLLIPKSHPSRSKNDCYYINKENLLRAHTTAHQIDLIRSGLDNFLVTGEVYRKDEIDSTHYPVFHQLDAVRIMHRDKIFKHNPDLEIFESSYKINPNSFSAINSNSKCIDQSKQPCHTLEAVKLTEHEMKKHLVGLSKTLFGDEINYRWVDNYFPFTQPSWELEIFYNNKWLEVLGSGIIRNEILQRCGVHNSIGYAFGLGLERLAMILFDIPDIRLFWSTDSGFLNQFDETNLDKIPKYKTISSYPQCINDLSFWLPENLSLEDFSVNDFYDLARNIAGDIIEQISIIDQFKHPKTGKTSLCFRIVYRHLERTLTQSEVNNLHETIANEATKLFKIVIR